MSLTASYSTVPSGRLRRFAAQEHMIQPDLQRALAAKIKAKTTVLDTGHVPMLTAPAKVAAVIEDAARQAAR